MPKKYYKITNAKEKHHGYQYKEGLNILDCKFDNDKTNECSDGGLYFSDAKNILNFLDFGVNLREIYLPTSDKKLKYLKSDNDKWRANRIILGKKYSLSKTKTIKMLIKNGAKLQDFSHDLMDWAIENGCKKIIKFLVKKNLKSTDGLRFDWDVRKLIKKHSNNLGKLTDKILKL